MDSCVFAGVSSLIALFALMYNNRQANYRETRKEIRAKLDNLNAELNALLGASKNYYLGKDISLSIETTKIHEANNACQRHIEELNHMKGGISLFPEYYIIYEMVTGGNFESTNHKPGDHFVDLCKKISIQKELLITKAEGWFNKQYR